MKLIWLYRNMSIYDTLTVHQKINLKQLSGCSLQILMFQHPEVLRNRIRRFILP